MAAAPADATILVRALSSSGADAISVAALTEARRLGIKPVSVAVVDVAGRLLMHRSEDGVGTLTPGIALAKSKTCVSMNISSRMHREKYAAEKPTQLTALGQIAGGQFAPFPGGVLLRDPSDNSIVGAVGISGAAGEEDEHCAIAGAKALNFLTEPAQSVLL